MAAPYLGEERAVGLGCRAGRDHLDETSHARRPSWHLVVPDRELDAEGRANSRCRSLHAAPLQALVRVLVAHTPKAQAGVGRAGHDAPRQVPTCMACSRGPCAAAAGSQIAWCKTLIVWAQTSAGCVGLPWVLILNALERLINTSLAEDMSHEMDEKALQTILGLHWRGQRPRGC